MTELRKGTRAELRAEVEIVESGPAATVISIPGVTPRLIVPLAMLTPILEPEPPVGSVVIDCDGGAWQRCPSGWAMAGAAMVGLTWDWLNNDYGPVRVVFTPEDDDE